MATGAADGFFRCVYDGCISGSDMGIERRPYHKNCGCALHDKSKNKKSGSYSNCTHKSKNVSYPLRRSWSEGSLALNLAAPSTNSSPPSSSSSSSTLSSSLSSSSLVTLPMGYYNYNCEE